MQKMIVLSIIAAMVAVAVFFAVPTGAASQDGLKGLVLTDLWKQYGDASSKDLPRKQLEILDRIVDEASSRKLPWDFYCACERRVQARVMINWKERDDAKLQFRNAVEKYGLPVMTFHYLYGNSTRDEALGYAKSHARELRNSNIPQFREAAMGDWDALRTYVCSLCRNDLEYAFWAFAVNSVTAREELAAELDGRYPDIAVVEYLTASETYVSGSRQKSLSRHAEKYAGKAASLLSRQSLLSDEFHALQYSHATSEQFLEFRDRCRDFEKFRKSFSGEEKRLADVCDGVASILSELESRQASVRVENGRAELVLRNLDRIKLLIRTDDERKTAVYRNTVTNPKNSFYVRDTLTIDLPALNDGDYVLEYSGSEVEASLDYRKTTLSLATRQDAGGWSFYVADYLTGKPVDKVDMTLFNEDKEVMTLKGVSVNAFTRIPSQIVSRYGRHSNMIRCSFTDADGVYRRTDRVYIDKEPYREPRQTGFASALVFTDRAAFTPGETVSFKTVLYSGDGTGYAAAPEGRSLKAVLSDAQGKDLASLDLLTNAFGSAAGSFAIPTGSRNGIFMIRVVENGDVRGSAHVRVDEFVLPSFDVTFEPQNTLYLSGDDVRIKGYARSYSGHSLAAATVRACIHESWRNSSDDRMETVTVADDGSFEILAKSLSSGFYRADVKVVDNTGETLEFGTSFYVHDDVPLSVSVLGTADASCPNVIDSDRMDVKFTVGDDNVARACNGDIDISWRLLSDDRVVSEGTAAPGGTVGVSLAGLSSGTYVLKTSASVRNSKGEDVKGKNETTVHKISADDKVFNSDMENLFIVTGDDGVSVRFAAGRGPVWACVEIFGAGNVLLRNEMVYLEGVRGREGSVRLLSYGYPKAWSDVVTLNVFYFRNGTSYSYSHEFRRQRSLGALPLKVSRFSDVTSPATEYSVVLDSEAGVEGLVSVFDKSTESIMPNWWNGVSLSEVSAPSVYYRRDCGSDASVQDLYRTYDCATGSARTKNAVFLRQASANDMVVVEEACAFLPLPDGDRSAESAVVRENFANTLAFEPFIRTDGKGRMSMTFKTSDKLSTYVIQAFAHDRNMRNTLVREEFKVTIPVKVSVMEPQLLYAGDRYVVKANLSSTCSSIVSGRVALYLYESADHRQAAPVASYSSLISVNPGSSSVVEFPVNVPSASILGMKIVFTGIADGTSVSDAVFVSVPVRKTVQTIREAHSSILLSGRDRDSLITELRSRFVNLPSSAAELSETTIMDMVKAALPSRITPRWNDALSVVDALYASSLSGSLGNGCEVPDSLVAKVMECRNRDGGFGWFAGMTSSPQITAAILGRAASLRSRGLSLGLEDEVLAEAVAYLDGQQFASKGRPWWCGGISDSRYLYIRAQYAGLKLAAKPDSRFMKDARAYLVPSGKRGLQGCILDKALRLRTLLILTSSDDGIALARSLGVRLSAGRKMRKSLAADESSLLEYAVAHESGGMYFPNAVMPLRGLMDSELYAHSLLCDLFRDLGDNDMAEGIRIWIMVQKETQKWEDDPAFVEAIASVMDGSEAVRNTSVIILSAAADLPFEEVKASGNGFTIELSYVREGGERVKDGDVLHVGENIIATCRIWNGENRSFVHVVVPRPASLRPVNQLSGGMRWWLAPISVGGWRSFSPQGYRNVKAGETEYFFDSYPEENTEISEVYHVTQEGSFSTPAVTIESLYAPHYRANGAYRGRLLSE